MSATPDINSVQGLLEHIRTASANQESVSVDTILSQIGRRSFGPILLTVGLFLAVPGLSDIPTVPTILGTLIAVVGIQIVVGRNHIWMPGWLLRKKVKTKRVHTAIEWVQKPAYYADQVLKSRLLPLATGTGRCVAAVVCILLALLTPLMELVPFSSNLAGVAFTFFGLGLVGRDGLMNAIGFSICLILVGTISYGMVAT